MSSSDDDELYDFEPAADLTAVGRAPAGRPHALAVVSEGQHDPLSVAATSFPFPQGLDQDEGFQKALQTAHGHRSVTGRVGGRLATQAGGRLGTAMVGGRLQTGYAGMVGFLGATGRAHWWGCAHSPGLGCAVLSVVPGWSRSKEAHDGRAHGRVCVRTGC